MSAFCHSRIVGLRCTFEPLLRTLHFMVTFKKTLLCFLIFWTISNLHAQSKATSKVLAAEQQRFEAMMRADTQTLRAFLSETLVYVHSNALVEDKSAHLSAIASKKLVYENMERVSAEVQIYGKTALVNGVLNVKGILNGNAFEIRLLYLAVYRKKHGNWQLIRWQSTRKV